MLQVVYVLNAMNTQDVYHVMFACKMDTINKHR